MWHGINVKPLPHTHAHTYISMHINTYTRALMHCFCSFNMCVKLIIAKQCSLVAPLLNQPSLLCFQQGSKYESSPATGSMLLLDQLTYASPQPYISFYNNLTYMYAAFLHKLSLLDIQQRKYTYMGVNWYKCDAEGGTWSCCPVCCLVSLYKQDVGFCSTNDCSREGL